MRISKKRAPVERHYAVIKRVFNAGHVLGHHGAAGERKMTFTAFGFDLYQLHTLRKQGVV